MADYSLVPVDHQPDFGDASLVPVAHDPFGADGVMQPAQPPLPAANPGQGNADAPANGTPTPEAGESWDPDNENTDITAPGLSTASVLPPDDVPFKPFGELKPATFTPTQRIGYLAADGATALGMQPYIANDLTKRIGNVLGLIPQVAVASSALDLIDAKRRDDVPGAIMAAAGMILGAKGIAREVAEASAASVANKLTRYLLDPEHASGGPKAQWFEQALGFTRGNAESLANQLIFDESQAVQKGVNKQGTLFNQTINVTGANGRTIPVTTGWIVGSDGVPRLVTAFPAR